MNKISVIQTGKGGLNWQISYTEQCGSIWNQQTQPGRVQTLFGRRDAGQDWEGKVGSGLFQVFQAACGKAQIIMEPHTPG